MHVNSRGVALFFQIW